MLDVALIREQLDVVRAAMANRGEDLSRELDELARLESERSDFAKATRREADRAALKVVKV